MKQSDLSPDEKQFNDESNFLDDLYEFHPQCFVGLTKHEREVLKQYYLIESDAYPENIFSYRASLIRMKPGIDRDARALFKKIIAAAGMVEFRQ
jgi:hypothetical protein